MRRVTSSTPSAEAPVPVVPHAPSRLFFAVVASGIALGAAACSVSASVTESGAAGGSNGTAESPAGDRLLATPTLGSGGTDAGASDASADASDAALSLHDAAADAHADAADGGWEPTK